MIHRKTEPNARGRTIQFVINFHAFNLDFYVTATLITAGHITVRNKRLIFCTFTVSGRATAAISLVIALVIGMASALVIRAPPFLIMGICCLRLLLIAVLIFE